MKTTFTTPGIASSESIFSNDENSFGVISPSPFSPTDNCIFQPDELFKKICNDRLSGMITNMSSHEDVMARDGYNILQSDIPGMYQTMGAVSAGPDLASLTDGVHCAVRVGRLEDDRIGAISSCDHFVRGDMLIEENCEVMKTLTVDDITFLMSDANVAGNMDVVGLLKVVAGIEVEGPATFLGDETHSGIIDMLGAEAHLSESATFIESAIGEMSLKQYLNSVLQETVIANLAGPCLKTMPFDIIQPRNKT